MTKYVIYMASGSGKRFGENKLLADFSGMPLFMHGLEMLSELSENDDTVSVTVVSRYKDIRDKAKSMGIKAIDCPESDKGLSYTIRTGISSIINLKDEDFLVFMVADQPYLKVSTMRKLLAAAKNGTETARLYYKDIPGNPCMFSAKLKRELIALKGDQGGGTVIKNHQCVPVYVENSLELKDIDVKEDLL